MTICKFDDIILVPFPFTDQTSIKKRPAVVVVVKLAKAFDVSVDHLLFDDAPKRPLHELTNRLADKIMRLGDMSEEDEKNLLHVVSAIEGKNKLKPLMAYIK